ncbi:hypothetical protein ACLESO_20180 [Pyxidicoccus sp. 3LG]
MREGASHFHLRERQAPPGRVRQFIHGLSLPFHLARALLGDPVARGRYLRVGLLQTVAALALALTCMGSGNEAVESARDRQEDAAAERAVRELTGAAVARELRKAEAQRGRQREETEARVAEILREVGVTLPPRDGGTVRPSRRNAAAVAPQEDGGTAVAAAESLPTSPDAGEATAQVTSADAGSVSPEQARALAQARLEQRIRDMEAAAQGRDAGTSLSDAIAALVLETAALAKASSGDDSDEAGEADDSEDEDGGAAGVAKVDPPRGDDEAPQRESPPKVEAKGSPWMVQGFSVWGLAFWGALFAALQLAQWVVIAMSREYHDAIARDASLLTGVKPEDDEVTPRIHVDVPWIRKKVKRRWRAFILFIMGFPALALLSMPFMCSSTLFSILSSAWGAWWLVVFTAAKSGHAWEAVGEPRPPWFLRAWTWATTRVPGLRWGVLQRYGERWSRRTSEVLAPVATVERHPWAFAGLALVRFLGAFPPMKFFIRPLIPVASAHLLAHEDAARAALSPPPGKPAIPAGETGS